MGVGINNIYTRKIYALAQDPIYVGTGGYKIGRVDNTIVRDPSTNEPKIPGSSLAGVWRYYSVLKICSCFKSEEYKINKKRKEKLENFLRSKGKTKWEDLDEREKEEFMEELFDTSENYIQFEGNIYIGIKCAGQDDAPNINIEDIEKEDKPTGHCGRCIVCKSFGFSKKNLSWQGLIFFSDLEILFFPVFTYRGTKWITTKNKLEKIGINSQEVSDPKKILIGKGNQGHENNEENQERYLNLGWLYLEVKGRHDIENRDLDKIKFNNFKLKPEDIVIVPEDLFSQTVNSNLEVRTSVSIEPITGAAKEGALFTSEAIPRGTIFFGEIRIFDKKFLEDIDKKIKPVPDVNLIKEMLEDSAKYFEVLGIGGMTTRGFGRLKMLLENEEKLCITKKNLN